MTLRQLIEVMRRSSGSSEVEVDDDSVIDIINEEVRVLLAEFPVSMMVRLSLTGLENDISGISIIPDRVIVNSSSAIKVTSDRMERAVGDEL